MKTRLFRVGNSYCVRLPKGLLEKAGLGEAIEVTVRNSEIVVTAAAHPRDGWGASIKLLRERGDDFVLDESVAISLDDTEWQW